ncbi:MAG: LysR substrate-binding domain-containing protein, partial [Pseudomonadota bacterium]
MTRPRDLPLHQLRVRSVAKVLPAQVEADQLEVANDAFKIAEANELLARHVPISLRVRPIVESFDAALSETVRENRPDQGRLRITAPVSLGLQVIPEMLDSFKQTYPNIAIDVSFTDTLIDVISETCDLAIRVSGPPKDQSTVWRKLCDVPRRAVASPDFLERVGPLNHPDDLKAPWMMSYSASSASELWEFSSAGLKRSRRAGDSVVTNSGD